MNRAKDDHTKRIYRLRAIVNELRKLAGNDPESARLAFAADLVAIQANEMAEQVVR